jgi:hypothetical protein
MTSLSLGSLEQIEVAAEIVHRSDASLSVDHIEASWLMGFFGVV